MYVGYTDLVEVPTVVRRLGRPFGPILDAGCGTGRITEALVPLGQPIVAIDYSEACLRRMQARTAGARVLPVQSDLRNLPAALGRSCRRPSPSKSTPTCATATASGTCPSWPGCWSSGGPLSISTLNYNLVFRAWQAFGNDGAREGEHVLGNDYHYRRFDRSEFRQELSTVLRGGGADRHPQHPGP